MPCSQLSGVVTLAPPCSVDKLLDAGGKPSCRHKSPCLLFPGLPKANASPQTSTLHLSDLPSPICLSSGPVTNAFIVLAPANMLHPDSKPNVPLPKFSKHLHGTESSDAQGGEGVTLRLGLDQQVLACPTCVYE